MRCIALLVFLSCAGFVNAQGDGTTGREIEREITRMRDLLRAGKVVTTNVRVVVRLNNGNKLQGVVKNGRLIERVDELRFVAAEAGDRDAGIRLWYHDNTDSYIFVPFRTVLHYQVGEQLTSSQLASLERSIAEQRQRAEEERKKYIATLEREKERRRRIEEAQQGAGPNTGEPAAPAIDPEQERLLALLTEYPPEEGWGEERRHTIETLKVSAGVFPDEKGRRFLDIFPDWLKALRLREAQTPPLPVPGSGKN